LSPRVSVVSGSLTIALYASCTLVAFVIYPLPFGITTNYLSDLGNSISSPHGASVYNAGLILAGVLLLPFFAGLRVWYSTITWRRRLVVATQALGFAEAFALVMLGLNPETNADAHALWSNIQFFVNVFVLSLSTAAFTGDPRFIKPIGVYAFVAIALQIATLVLIVLGHASPLVEWLTVFTTLLFVALVSWNMHAPAFRRAS